MNWGLVFLGRIGSNVELETTLLVSHLRTFVL